MMKKRPKKRLRQPRKPKNKNQVVDATYSPLFPTAPSVRNRGLYVYTERVAEAEHKSKSASVRTEPRMRNLKEEIG